MVFNTSFNIPFATLRNAFGGGEGWFSGKIQNLPPRKVEKSSMNENSSPGFTPTNSFKSDVMGISPIDEAESDNL